MTETRGFRDQPQVEQIRERLWSGREFGRAAVMVGAGYSRNANSSSPGGAVFPSWGGLAEAMYDVLYPPDAVGGATRDDQKKRMTSGAGAMRLASEYETVFGRAALDDFLARSVPDELYEPGPLHELLLRLPWSDVFTTNYDTLIERAQPKVHERKYDLVLTTSDLPSRAKPRIVKLHGSFPSHRPFVITEDDYRTYPTKFAPFVNMVQQSIMENAFCLLGFSGEDPNFLSWTGWVRDNLGSSIPPIYLCGLLNLSNSQRRLLESRNVIPVDLSPEFPSVEWHDPAQRHAKALEWFLGNLMEGEPPRVDVWPVPSRVRPWEPSEGLPDVPPGPSPIPDPGPQHPPPAQYTLDDIDMLYTAWRRTRLSYPGWIVAPERNRRQLWERTEYWILPILEAVTQMSPPNDMFLLYELNWRLEKSLVPLFLDWTETISRVLGSYNPYPNLIAIEGARIEPSQAEYAAFDWERVTACWVELVFAVAREAREDQDEGRFRLWMDRLRSVVHRRSDWQARWFYEESVFHMSRLDQETVRTTLQNWPNTRGLPLWELRRASILAELGDLETAGRMASEALDDVRSRLLPYSSDYALLSWEGSALFLLQGITANDLGSQRSFRARYRDRQRELGGYGCDPWTEIGNFEGTVVGVPPPLRDLSEKTTLGFDPGMESITTNFPTGLNVGPILPAFALLRMSEVGALPPRIGNVNMFSATVPAATRWIDPHAPLWSFSSLVRQAKAKDVYVRCDRVYVATLPGETFDYLFNILHNSLIQSAQRLSSNSQEVNLQGESFAHRQVKIGSELLSRLSIRCSEQQREVLFDLAEQMYRRPLFSEHHWYHDCVDALFKRLLSFSMSHSEIMRWMPQLLGLPIPSEAGFEVSTPERWVEPFDYLSRRGTDRGLGSGLRDSSWDSPIANLIRIIRDGAPEARSRATVRLGWLYQVGALTDDESRAFGAAIWSQIDSTSDLPTVKGLYRYAFLHLPELEAGSAKQYLRQYLRSSDFMRMVQTFSYPDGTVTTSISGSPSSIDPYTRELLGANLPLFPRNEIEKQKYVDWNLEEVVDFLQKAVRRWEEEKEALLSLLGEQDNFSKRDIIERLEDRLRVLSEVVLPRLGDADGPTKTAGKRLVSELKQAGLSVNHALPTLLYVDSELYNDIAHDIRAGIASADGRQARTAVHGLFLWLAHAADAEIAFPPDDLLETLVNIALSRKQAALDTVLNCLCDVVRELPDVLNDRQLDTLCFSLEHFIEDTELPEHSAREREDQRVALIPVEQRPRYRELAAQLAYQLSKEFGRRERERPNILQQWERVCREDPLPEVRQAWERQSP